MSVESKKCNEITGPNCTGSRLTISVFEPYFLPAPSRTSILPPQAGEWSKLQLPHPDFRGLPANEIPGPSLVLVDENYMKKARQRSFHLDILLKVFSVVGC